MGGFIGSASYTPCTRSGFGACLMHPESRTESAKRGAITYGLIGGLVGALIGSDIKTSTGGKAEIRPVVYKPVEAGGSALYHVTSFRIRF